MAHRLLYSILVFLSSDGIVWFLFFHSVLSCATLSGTFKLTLQFNEEYPNKPPTVRFISRMFHPNSKLFHLIFRPKYTGDTEIVV
jgi:hypothetical protein